MNDALIGFLPLIFMTLIVFLLNMWIAKKCKVWTTPIIILSLIPIVNNFTTLLIFIKAIEALNTRIEQLEGNHKSEKDNG